MSFMAQLSHHSPTMSTCWPITPRLSAILVKSWMPTLQWHHVSSSPPLSCQGWEHDDSAITVRRHCLVSVFHWLFIYPFIMKFKICDRANSYCDGVWGREKIFMPCSGRTQISDISDTIRSDTGRSSQIRYNKIRPALRHLWYLWHLRRARIQFAT